MNALRRAALKQAKCELSRLEAERVALAFAQKENRETREKAQAIIDDLERHDTPHVQSRD